MTALDVVNSVKAALDTAENFAGVPLTSGKIADLEAKLQQAQSDLAAANAKIANAKAALA